MLNFPTQPTGNSKMTVIKKSNQYKNKLFQFIFVTIFSFLCLTPSHAQVTDTTSGTKKFQTENSSKANLADSTKKFQNKLKYRSPKKAALMSTIVPGLGQVYNKKYWKVPIIYASVAGLAYSFTFNQSKYITYLNAYKYRLDGGSLSGDNFPNYPSETLNSLQEYYKRYRDLTVIGASLLYLMNIVDAAVDAHMSTFDVGDDLSFNIQPTLINIAHANQYTTGLSLNITF